MIFAHGDSYGDPVLVVGLTAHELHAMATEHGRTVEGRAKGLAVIIFAAADDQAARDVILRFLRGHGN